MTMDRAPDNFSFTQNMDSNNNLNRGPEFKRKVFIDKEKQKQSIVTSGNKFITAFQKLLQSTKANKEDRLHYMQRVLHTIFFFGHINKPQIGPEEFIPEEKVEVYKKWFKSPFKEYNTHFPRQTPYSILVEYMTKAGYAEDPKLLMQELVELNKSLWKPNGEDGNQLVANDFAFSASVITYSYITNPKGDDTLKFAYGASLSCKGKTQRRIMIDILALYVWDKAISYAVSCGDSGHGIVFPDEVHCKAFKFDTENYGYKEIPPCIKCHKMFLAHFDPKYKATNRPQPWRYGNCAETESLSKLLYDSEDLRNKVYTFGDNREPMNMKEILKSFKAKHESKMWKELRTCLISCDFNVDPCDAMFFTPAA